MFNVVQKVVKKGGEAVSSTAQAMSGGSKSVPESFDADNMIKNAKGKYDIDLKCTPSKDALTCTKLSCHNGFIVKKNEQGNWQRRYVCLVPHTFLYYFDSDSSIEPRGVIDLELYTNLSVEGSDCTIMKMSTLDENEKSPLKSFYFQFDDPNAMSEWMTAVIRDKFNVVKEERDQYLSLQGDVASIINNSKKASESTALEKDKMQQDIIRTNQINEENMTQMRRILVRFGISENDMKKLDTGVKICENILMQIDKMRDMNDRSVKENRIRELDEKKLLEERIAQMETSIVQEAQSRRQWELNHSNHLQELQNKLEEAMGEIERAGLNTQMAVAAKSAAENKVSTLKEEKKILVKEVKQLRSKGDEDKESITSLQSSNEKLNSQLTSLQERFIQLSSITSNNAKERMASSQSLSSKDEDSSDSGSSTHGNSRSISNEASSFDEKKSLSLLDSFTSSPSTSGGSFPSLQNLFNNNNISSSFNVGAGSTTDHISANNQKEVADILTQPGANVSINAEDADTNNTGHGNNSDGFFGFMQTNNTKQESSRPLSINNKILSSSVDKSNRRSSLDMLSSMFSFDKNEDESNTDGGATRDVKKEAKLINLYDIYDKNEPLIQSDGQVEAHNSMFTSPFASKPDSDSGEASSSEKESGFKLRCLRCNGTVEGPLYSTCKCTTPALSPDDLKEGPSIKNIFGSIFS